MRLQPRLIFLELEAMWFAELFQQNLPHLLGTQVRKGRKRVVAELRRPAQLIGSIDYYCRGMVSLLFFGVVMKLDHQGYFRGKSSQLYEHPAAFCVCEAHRAPFDSRNGGALLYYCACRPVQCLA